ncbi:polyprenyl synthetase family protein [Nocardia coubleae]|uniref:Uncharacterized protein n=1 Tax=Nocardia coubleae TaxID=356147 RepID=A0A846VZN1_9NOCA|nr:polyprenyl synthetase family protein [Nocardia coubleae]NKX85996.1 hypothetical protein [Nocardia coubleae]
MNEERAATAADPRGLSTDDGSTQFARWLAQTQRSVRDHVDEFVRARCAASEPALRAAASVGLLHAFALVRDDVMDGSRVGRERQSTHLRLAAWHTEQR